MGNKSWLMITVSLVLKSTSNRASTTLVPVYSMEMTNNSVARDDMSAAASVSRDTFIITDAYVVGMVTWPSMVSTSSMLGTYYSMGILCT